MSVHTVTKENYIKALFYLHQRNKDISLSELSQDLQVSKPTANAMMKKLQSEGMVKADKYKPIHITTKGKKHAASIIRKHRLSEMFLQEVMGFGWEEVHEIAEDLEHIKVDKFFDRMDQILGFPEVDPHGSPIPSKDGMLEKSSYKRLSQIDEGKTVVLRALKDSSTDLLKFLNKKSIALDTKMQVKSIESFDRSYTILYDKNATVVLGQKICDALLVEEV